MSDDPSSTRFAKLNDSNYAEWSIRMEAELIRKGLWSVIEIVVDGDGKDKAAIAAEYALKKGKRSAQKMSEARAEMILRVEGGQLSHMRSRDPIEIWESLRTVHRARGFATTLALRRKFLTSKKKPNQTMQSWIGDIQSLAFYMADSGIEVTDQDKVLAVTMGLPSSYDALIINFDSISSNLLTFDHVITRLLNEETRQGSGLRSRTTTSVPSISVTADEAMAAAGSRRPTPICYFCNEAGHVKSDCKEHEQWEASKKAAETSAHVTEDFQDSDSEGEPGF